MEKGKKFYYEGACSDRYELLKDFARENRNNPTLAESQLWEYLRRESLGVKFRRQHVILDYIADFICLEKKLIIEVDGGYHNTLLQQEEDLVRTNRLQNNGFSIMRFTNEEVLFETERVIKEITNKLINN